MKTVWNAIQVAFSALGGFVGYFLGGLDGFLYALPMLRKKVSPQVRT